MPISGFHYGTRLTVSAITPPADSMFVGWDMNNAGHRLEGEQEMSDFSMPGETTTLWANFSQIRKKKLITARTDIWHENGNKQQHIHGWNKPGDTETYFSEIDGTAQDADPDLEGFSGYTVTIPANRGGTVDYNEDIKTSELNTIDNPSQAIRVIFKNRGDHDVTVELYTSQITNICTTGHVTVPAGQKVVKTFVAGIGYRNPDWGFNLRRTLNSSNSVPLDIVLGCADAYPKGDRTLWVPNGTQRVELVNPVNPGAGKTGIYYSPTSNAITHTVTNACSWTHVMFYEHWIRSMPCVMTAKLKNLPEYDPEDPYVTVYVKMINHAASDNSYEYRFALGTNIDPLDGGGIRSGSVAETVIVTTHGEVRLFRLRVPRSAGQTDFYFSMIKQKYDNATNTNPEEEGKLYYAMNYSLMLTYNNGIGYDDGGGVTE